MSGERESKGADSGGHLRPGGRRRKLLTGGALALVLVMALAGTASAAAPVVTTKSATEMWGASANLHGTVNPTGLATTYWFEYGPTTSYGSKTAETSAGSGISTVEESARITGLTPESVYHFRLVASSAGGTTKGADSQIITSPSAVTESATEVFAREAKLDGAVLPEGISTTYWFEYGPTTSYGSKTAELSAGSGTSSVKESASLGKLTAGTTYHYRIAMSNAYGTQKGHDKTFTTLTAGWSLQSTPNPEGLTNSHLSDVSCVSGSECMAVGHSDNLLAESWNGSEWSLISPPEAGTSINELRGVSCAASSACVAVGLYWTSETSYRSLAESWNGSEWTIQEVPVPAGASLSVLEGVSCTSASFCIAAGRYRNSEGNWDPLAESWNGSEWKLQEVPRPAGSATNYLFDISCTSASACTAVGYATGNILAERWNGSEWKVQTTPATGASLEGVSCASASFCMATGGTTGLANAYAASWNGSEWKSSEAVTPTGAKTVDLTGVACPSTTVCFAVGSSTSEAGTAALAESWNGTKWEIQPVPHPFSTSTSLAEVSCVSTKLCEAVGSFNDGLSKTLAERYE